MEQNYDFGGWATKFNRRCSDGRVIRESAFDDDDGLKVPLVYQHNHKSPDAILGHALLEKRPGEGMYAYCYFNNTEMAGAAKEAVRHKDVTSLSIHANRLKQTNQGDVLHGRIREVSIVLTGANPDAKIDVPVLLHMDYMDEDSAIIFSGEDLDDIDNVLHADDEDDEEDPKNEPESKDKGEKKGRSMIDIWNELNEEQQKMVYSMLAMATGKKSDSEMAQSDEDEDGEEEISLQALYHSDYEGGNDMRRNVFETNNEGLMARPQYELTHSDFEEIMSEAKRSGSLRDAFHEFIEYKCDELSHSDLEIGEKGDATYGVADIDWLFPEAKLIDETPQWIKRDTDWVADVMSNVHHTPFSRIKSLFADITADEARARGYTKGKKKVEEVFTLLKRSTSPTTAYKKQKMDRDDRLDITGFNILAWLKSEMRLMLDEELARAYLVGDGRNPMSDDKIKEDCIRPIWTDDELFTIHYKIDIAEDADEDTIANETIRAAIKSRKDYKGSGSLTMYTTEEAIINMLLLEDGIGNRKYKTREELATALGVNKIVAVPVFEGLTREDDETNTRELVGIIVNMKDYTVGADKGGAVELFEDFDIDYNQEKYLIETRCSGALTKPKSAIALEIVRAS